MDISIKGLSKVSILTILDQKINQLERKLESLKIARAILVDEDVLLETGVKSDGHEAPEPAPLPVPRSPAKPVDLAPICDGCGKGRMRPAMTRAPSGVYINMLRCDDGACNNEVY